MLSLKKQKFYNVLQTTIWVTKAPKQDRELLNAENGKANLNS